jgi:hypothetical protein
MKFTTSILVSLLPFLVLSSPIADAEPIEDRASKVCHTIRATGCYAGAGRGYTKKHSYPKDLYFTANCRAYGESVHGYE